MALLKFGSYFNKLDSLIFVPRVAAVSKAIFLLMAPGCWTLYPNWIRCKVIITPRASLFLVWHSKVSSCLHISSSSVDSIQRLSVWRLWIKIPQVGADHRDCSSAAYWFRTPGIVWLFTSGGGKNWKGGKVVTGRDELYPDDVHLPHFHDSPAAKNVLCTWVRCRLHKPVDRLVEMTK